MKILKAIGLLISGAALAVRARTASPYHGTVLLANIAEGTHDGCITKAVDAAVTERFLLAKVGSASDRVAVAGAADWLPKPATNQVPYKRRSLREKWSPSNIGPHLVAMLRQALAELEDSVRMLVTPTVLLANIAEGTHDGNITKAVDAAITERFLLAKVGSASDRVAVCTAADVPIGVITDEAANVGDIVNVALFGSARSTLRMVASGAITQGSLLEPAASGRVQTLGAGVGTHHVVGRALDAAANAGDVIEVDPHYFLRVI